MSHNRLTVRGRGRRSILNAGGNRAARANVVAYRTHNEQSTATAIVPYYADPALNRAEEAARHARSHGVEAEAIEARAEDVLDGTHFDGVVGNVDNAGTTAALLRLAGELRIPALGQLVVQLPSTRTLGVQYAHAADDDERRAETQAFFEGLHKVTSRSGASAIFGEAARGRGAVLEPLIRESFAAHTRAELSRLTAGIAPEHAPLEITDGVRAMPLLVVERPTFGEPTDVVLQVAEAPAVPLRRGTLFFVAEVTPAGIRLHEARRRQLDGRFAVRESTTIDERSVLAARARPSALVNAVGTRASASERHSLDLLFGLAVGVLAGAAAGNARAAARASIEALRSDTLSATSPVLTTD